MCLSLEFWGAEWPGHRGGVLSADPIPSTALEMFRSSVPSYVQTGNFLFLRLCPVPPCLQICWPELFLAPSWTLSNVSGVHSDASFFLFLMLAVYVLGFIDFIDHFKSQVLASFIFSNSLLQGCELWEVWITEQESEDAQNWSGR